MAKKNISVLVVGQTPPPFGGQAVMIRQLLDAQMDGICFHHVRMAFSDDMDAIGRFQFKKITHLIAVIWNVVLACIRYRPSMLYYPPAGPNRVPFYRDAILLIFTRWMFSKTVFHFHASGISTLYADLGRMERLMFRLAYSCPDLAIRTSVLNPDDGAFLNAKKSIVVQNGLPDVYPRFQAIAVKNRSVPRILFVGALYEAKGIRVLIEACGLLKQHGLFFEVQAVGRFESAAYEADIRKLVEREGLCERVVFSGVLSGDDKWKAYAGADIFCFPSFFESESFGLVNIEAMQFALPVVSTNWRGIPGVVQDGENGFLVAIRDPKQVAEKLALLLGDPALRCRMGAAGRRIFLEHFSAPVWLAHMKEAFTLLEDDV